MIKEQGRENILVVRNLVTSFRTPAGMAVAVDGLSFSLGRNETIGIVGESGSGKSVTALSIMGLLPSQSTVVAGGPIIFEGHDLLQYSEREMQHIRGNRISMIFQEPMNSLNPVLTVGFQLRETIMLHKKNSQKACRRRANELINLVRIPDATERMKQYPYQLSGGMRQRVMIAMALSCSPEILIADEPTTALDVTVQAQILSLIAELKQRTGTSVIFITHDLGVVAEVADRVIVMYAGKCFEEVSVDVLFTDPKHPYTIGLLTAVPRLGASRRTTDQKRLVEIPGTVPGLMNKPRGCSFAPRCSLVVDHCREKTPPLEPLGDGHKVACWRHDKVGELLQ